MQREIKFRAWDKGAKQLYNVSDMTFSKKGCCIVRTNNGEMFTGLKNAENYKLMQYTGLHDKNGREIYEGDIFHLGDKKLIYQVVWHDSGLSGKQFGCLGSYVGLQHWRDRIEVIGNVWEDGVKDENNSHER